MKIGDLVTINRAPAPSDWSTDTRKPIVGIIVRIVYPRDIGTGPQYWVLIKRSTRTLQYPFQEKQLKLLSSA